MRWKRDLLLEAVWTTPSQCSSYSRHVSDLLRTVQANYLRHLHVFHGVSNEVHARVFRRILRNLLLNTVPESHIILSVSLSDLCFNCRCHKSTQAFLVFQRILRNFVLNAVVQHTIVCLSVCLTSKIIFELL